ncbi:MAG: peptidase U32 [Deltaproteobacteria bacterium]|nr:peptidase U32 [Deltaproteobacteria bacterium]
MTSTTDSTFLSTSTTQKNDRAPRKKSELLMPAGSLEKLKAAVLYGADAIYMGTPDMSLRTKSQMSLADVVEGIEFAHARGKRVYLTLNLFSHNKDIQKLPEFIDTVRKVKPDGLIVADPGVFMFVKERAPELELHVSTQANVCSWQSVKFWQDIGAKLVVLAREVSFAELEEIRDKCPDIKLEAFVHGTMCMTYSGRCLLSNFMAERGANQGACANSCRWKYKVHMKMRDGTVRELNLTEENLELFDFFLEEECRPGELLPIEEDDRGSYILNAKDLCLMPKLDQYLALGIDSLKVEGRGKSPYYVGLVARAYRMAIDSYYEDPENWSSDAFMKELNTVPGRGYTTAFHDGRLTNLAHGYEHTGTMTDWEYGGIVAEVEEDAFLVTAKNKLIAGDVLEFVSPTRLEPMLLRIYEFINAKTGKVTDVVNPGQGIAFRVPFAWFEHEDLVSLQNDFPPMTILRKDRPLKDVEWKRLNLDQSTQLIEIGKGSMASIENQQQALRDAVDEASDTQRMRTKRVGTEGCCGRGCNGCLVFWHDPIYEKARGLLAKEKQGVMFKKDMKNIEDDVEASSLQDKAAENEDTVAVE